MRIVVDHGTSAGTAVRAAEPDNAKRARRVRTGAVPSARNCRVAVCPGLPSASGGGKGGGAVGPRSRPAGRRVAWRPTWEQVKRSTECEACKAARDGQDWRACTQSRHPMGLSIRRRWTACWSSAGCLPAGVPGATTWRWASAASTCPTCCAWRATWRSITATRTTRASMRRCMRGARWASWRRRRRPRRWWTCWCSCRTTTLPTRTCPWCWG
jgi:hypothetical protein